MIMTIQAWSLKVRDFTVPPRQPSLGAIAPRDGCLGGTVKSLTFRLHGSIVPFHFYSLLEDEEREKPSPIFNVGHKCQRLSKIGFLKMHKCGGTTVQNLLFRNAMERGLNVALPKLGLSMDPMRDAMAGTPWNSAEMDLFALHTRFIFPRFIRNFFHFLLSKLRRAEVACAAAAATSEYTQFSRTRFA